MTSSYRYITLEEECVPAQISQVSMGHLTLYVQLTSPSDNVATIADPTNIDHHMSIVGIIAPIVISTCVHFAHLTVVNFCLSCHFFSLGQIFTILSITFFLYVNVYYFFNSVFKCRVVGYEWD